jgi:hypothetical protein
MKQLCRSITRRWPTNACRNGAGWLVLKLKAPSRDSTAHLRMSPLEFMPLPIE